MIPSSNALRLVTWNCCRGPYEKKGALLDALAPDVAVLQECARPRTNADGALWFGDNPRSGIVVCARGKYHVEPLPVAKRAPKFIIPVRVTGPREFTLLAVWSKPQRWYPYVEAVVRAAELYRELIAAGPTVVIGDLNSNAIWDHEHPTGRSHSALVAELSRLGLVSSYHWIRGEAHGHECEATYYFQWNQKKPFHIDYCFIPKKWTRSLRRVQVGTYQEWRAHSDHRPIVVDVGT